MESNKAPAIRLHDEQTIRWERCGEHYLLLAHLDECPENPRSRCDHADIMACWHHRYTLGDKLDGSPGPDEFWLQLVREQFSGKELCEAIQNTPKLPFRIENISIQHGSVDVFKGFTCLCEAIPVDSLMDYMGDELTIAHCMELMKPYAEWLPLSLYDHSGITMSCGQRCGQFADPWDSCSVGWILMTKKAACETWSLKEDDPSWRSKAIEYMQASMKEYDKYLTGDVFWYELYEQDTNGQWGEEAIDSCSDFYGSNICENGVLDNFCSYGLEDAITADQYELKDAVKRTITYYDFR